MARLLIKRMTMERIQSQYQNKVLSMFLKKRHRLVGIRTVGRQRFRQRQGTQRTILIQVQVPPRQRLGQRQVHRQLLKQV